MKRALLVIIGLLVALVIYINFADRTQIQDTTVEEDIVTEDVVEDVVLEGVVVDIQTEQMAVDGPGLIVVEKESGEQFTIAIPSMGIRLCDAYENIADIGEVEIGDLIQAQGDYYADGDYYVPCEDASDFVTVTRRYENDLYNFAFTYKKSPNGYVVVEPESGDEKALDEFHVFNKADYEEFLESTEAREGPQYMAVRVYQNTDKLQPSVWADRNPVISQIQVAKGAVQETSLAGANAVAYTTDGLYLNDIYVVAHESRIYMVSGSYADVQGDLNKDFDQLVETFEFIQ